MTDREVNFDGIVGPTHNYAGLSYGNIASMRHKSTRSSPRQAALEGLAKMKLLMDLGVPQAVLPPHERPHLPTLRRLGFAGSDAQVLDAAYRADPTLLAAVCSASSMWAANAATVSPSADTADARVHFTPANLISHLHRSIETATTTRVLRRIFADERHFVIHDPLPASIPLADEGAANHMRLASTSGEGGFEVFVYGRRALAGSDAAPATFPARQTHEACTAIARNHRLHPAKVLLLRQNPLAIDGGAFHNDVVAVARGRILLQHTQAFAAGQAISLPGIEVHPADMPLADAVGSYVFNSQLLTLPDDSTVLIAPSEAEETPSARAYIERLRSDGVIRRAIYVNVRQSMHNGGGPACLRLGVILTTAEQNALAANVLLTPALHDRLRAWIDRHYRDELMVDDLRDPALLEESRAALDELSAILHLASIHDFQHGRA